MATITLTPSNWDSQAQLRITYTASNGTLKITELEGRRTDGYRSWDATLTSVSVSVGGTSKSISLSHYIDFTANSSWTAWGATDTSWTGLTGTSISISTTMPSTDSTLGSAKFSGNATMSWSKYTITYNANGGSLGSVPTTQTKTHGTALTLTSEKPTRTGYTFKGWALSKEDADSGTWYYAAGGSCGKNEDLTLYAVWEEHKLTLNYYSNYATSAFADTLNAVGSDKNVKVWTYDFYYDNDYSTYGLANYSNSSGSVYMTRTGYTGTGKWGTSTSGGTLIDEDAGYATGQALAKALGKDLSSGNASVNVYAQWQENALTVNYYSNYATYAAFQGVEVNASANTNVLVHSQKFYYDDSASTGLADVQNTNYIYITRVGYTATGYWGTSTNGGTLIDQTASYSNGQALAQAFGKSLANGNASVNVYPQWKANNYTLTLNANGGTPSVATLTLTYNTGNHYGIGTSTPTKLGYEFLGWYTSANGGTKVYDENGICTNEGTYWRDNVYVYANNLTLYAQWKPSGVIYIDNGSKLEPYLVYIDNGTSWDLYLAYIDNGSGWDIVS